MYYKSIRLPIARLFFTVLLLSFLIFTTASAQQPSKEWTFMIFMAADNNLEGGTSADINELEKVGSTANVNFVAQVDRIGEYSADTEWKWSGTKRFFITKDQNVSKVTSKAVADLGEVDMASQEALVDFVKWTKENYPAKKYALILWNHGTGWKEIQPSIMEADEDYSFSPSFNTAFDNISYNISYDNTSKSSMDIPSLRNTMAAVVEELGQPLDLLGFDACLMQMAEVSFAVAPFAKYQIGSPDLVPENGWPYDLIAKSLTKQPKATGKTLGSYILTAYKKSYSSGGTQGNTAVVISLIDLSKTEQFKNHLNDFCNTVRKNISDIDKFEKARDKALKYSYGDYIDLGHFLNIIKVSSFKAETKAAAQKLYQALIGIKRKGGFIYRTSWSGEKFQKTRGLSIFFPTRQGYKTYKNRYARLSFSKETEWAEFLREIANPNIPYLKIDDVIFDDENKDGRIAAGEKVTLRLIIKNLGRKPLTSAVLSCSTKSAFLDKKSFKATIKDLPKPGKTKSVKTITLTVSTETPVHTEIPLAISLKGKGLPVSSQKVSFLIKENFASTGHALLVITDSFSPGSPVLQDMFQQAKVKFDTWDRMLDGEIKPEVLKRYLTGWVFIAAQDSTPEQSLTEEEVETLTGFLEKGGRLVLNGQDLGFNLRDTDFLADKCKATFVQDDVNVHVISGTNNFAKNQDFQIFGGDGANNQKWPDELDALEGGQVILQYEEGARDMASDADMNGPSHKPGALSRGIKSTGAAGVKVIDGYRLILFSFGIEAINNKLQRGKIMRDIVKVMQPDVSSELRNYANTNRSATRARSVSSSTYLQRFELLYSVEDRLMKDIKSSVERNPASAESILREINNLEENDRSALKRIEKKVKTLLEFNRQHGTLRRR